MSAVILGVLALLTLGGIVLGLRHIYLRMARPRGFECSLRIVQGDVPGLTHRFRAGYAGREMDDFVFRRLVWPSTPVRFSARKLHFDEERAPAVRDNIVSVPAHFSVYPVDLEDGSQVQLALSRRKRKLLEAALGG